MAAPTIEELISTVEERTRSLAARGMETPVLVDMSQPVFIEGWVKDDRSPARRRARVHLRKDDFCLVVLPKPVAKAYGLVPCNTPHDMCIWDPVTGEVHCTDTRGLDEI